MPGEVLVRFRSEPEAEFQSQSHLRLQIQGGETPITFERPDAADLLTGLRLVRVDAADTLKAIATLNSRSDVLYAEPNYVREPYATPNDQYYKLLWSLHDTGSPGGEDGFPVSAHIHAEQAWEITTGSRSVVVGVVDGGIDVNHRDLQANVWINPAEVAGNNTDDDNNGYIDDTNGYDFFHNRGPVYDPADLNTERHGTHVAGIIGAVGNNGFDVVGVNWQVSLMSLKIFGHDGETVYPSNVQLLVRAYSYAKKMRDVWVSSGGTKGANIRVLNNSIGGFGFSQTELAAVQALNDSGILFVVAAGNDTVNTDVNPVYPACYSAPNVISVAATAPFDKLASFSNFGPRTVAISAPGSSYSTTPNNLIDSMSGTSMATPEVAGAAALICAAYPNITVARLKAALIYNGDFISTQAYKTLTGRRLNAFNSLQAVAENDTTAPANISDLRIVSQNGRSVTLAWTAPGDDFKTGTASLYEIRFSETDPSLAGQFEAATTISALAIPIPSVAGTLETATVDVPLRHTHGFIGVRATDNLGNQDLVAVVPVSVDMNSADPYSVTESAPQPLSTGGTQVQYFLGTDDAYSYDYQLPFAFPFFGSQFTRVTVSNNGALYFSPPPKFTPPPVAANGAPLDAFSSVRELNTYLMIAGLWDDLVRTGGVFAVTPDPNRIIFRWEATTYDIPFDDGTSRGVGPVNFEIELNKDGTITLRYGDGNQKLFPVVGISAGGPDSYSIASHTSENAFFSLANANTVTFAPRVPPVPTSGDLQVIMTEMTVVLPRAAGGSNYYPMPVAAAPGQVIQYKITVTDLGPDAVDSVVLTSQLPAGTSFIGCEDSQLTCSPPPNGTDGGTVTFNVGTLGDIWHRQSREARIQVRVNAPGGSTLRNTLTATSSTPDANPSNNSVVVATPVADFSTFGDVKAVYGNGTNILVIKNDGTVWSWGMIFGTGGSTNEQFVTPKPVPGLSNIVSLASAPDHALALKADGTVWAWGINSLGQLGTGSITEKVLKPVPLSALTNIQSIAVGAKNGAAAGIDGRVWTWGDNSLGQLGDGTTISHSLPKPLTTINGVRSVATNGTSTYAVKLDGTVWSWGSNRYGLLGAGTADESSLVPVRVVGLDNIQSVSTEDFHAVALRSDGTVWSWGNGSVGQLGNNARNDSSTPVQAIGLGSVSTVLAGSGTSVALKGDGTVWQWGADQLVPTQFTGVSGVARIGAWRATRAAIMPDNTLKLWSWVNGFGDLGDFTNTTANTVGLVRFLAVVAPPTFNPETSLSVFPNAITIESETPGAAIHYTTNGADPTESDPVVSPGSAIAVDHSMVIKARGWKNGYLPSIVTSKSFGVVATGNPIDESWSFVRQHYLDFLGREPDPSGLDYWNGQLAQCGSDQNCIRNKRIDVSNAFFYELEYQQTAAYVFRLYRAAFGNNQPFANPDNSNQTEAKKIPGFAAFAPDRALLIGSANLAQDQIALANAFVQRPEFLSKYQSNLTGPQFVDALLANIKNDSGADLMAQRDSLVTLFTQGGRGAVLYRVADDNLQSNPINNRVFIDAEYNRAFVASQYFGYLRRDSDIGGFLFWLGQVSGAPLRDISKQHAMVCSFVTSTEYQQRFSPIVTHSNSECSY